MIGDVLPETNAAIARLMRDKLGVGDGESLAHAVQKGGRRLPHAQRKQASYLVEQERIWGHPRLRRSIDAARVTRAQDDLTAFLKKLDRRDAFIGRMIGILAPLMFNILLIGIAVVVWLVWSGRV